MPLAFSTNAFTRFSLTDALGAIRSAGFTGVEILADAPHAWPPGVDPSTLSRLAKNLEQTGLAVSNLNANCSFGYWEDAPPEPYFEPSLISPNPRHRADRIALILQTLDIARALSAPNISITSGRCLAGMPPKRAAEQFTQSIRPILDRADQLNIRVGIECEPGLLIEYVTELRDWIDRLNHPLFGANLDIGHSQVMGEDIPDAVQLLAGRIWNMHLEDIPGRKHYHLVPGQGSIDWDAFAAAVRQIDYDRWLSVELYTHTDEPHAAARQSYEFLSQFFP